MELGENDVVEFFDLSKIYEVIVCLERCAMIACGNRMNSCDRLHLLTTHAGYTLSSLSETSTGLKANLVLAGSACNAFGHDITNLTLEVTYETKTR